MPNDPLFNVSLDELKSKMRLSGTVSDDALAIIDQAVMEVRGKIYAALGSDRVAIIAATPLVPNPVSEEHLDRTRAVTLEYIMVRAVLMRRLPRAFLDGSGDVREEWNTEPLLGNPQSRSKSELDTLQKEIDDLLDDLRNEEIPNHNGSANVVGPLGLSPLPGSSAYGSRRSQMRVAGIERSRRDANIW